MTDTEHRQVERNGRTYKMDTAKTGRTPVEPGPIARFLFSSGPGHRCATIPARVALPEVEPRAALLVELDAVR